MQTMDFSETIEFYNIKVRRCSQLGEYIKLYEYQRSRSFIEVILFNIHVSSALRWAMQDQWSSGLRL